MTYRENATSLATRDGTLLAILEVTLLLQIAVESKCVARFVGTPIEITSTYITAL